MKYIHETSCMQKSQMQLRTHTMHGHAQNAQAVIYSIFSVVLSARKHSVMQAQRT